MSTLMDVVRYEVNRNSEKIWNLKLKVFRAERAKKWGWILDGQPCPWGKDLSWEERGKQGIIWDEYEYNKVAECINPSHSRWEEYARVKRQVSLWLTAVRILKLAGGDVPAWGTVEAQAKGGLLDDHSPCHRSKHTARRALRLLKKLEGQASKVPLRPLFREALRWAANQRVKAHA